jgi:hypothetical protein
LVHEIHHLLRLASRELLAHIFLLRPIRHHHLHVEHLLGFLYGTLIGSSVLQIFDLTSQSLVHFIHADFIVASKISSVGSSSAIKYVSIETLAGMLHVHLLNELGLLVETHVLHKLLNGGNLRRVETLK